MAFSNHRRAIRSRMFSGATSSEQAYAVSTGLIKCRLMKRFILLAASLAATIVIPSSAPAQIAVPLFYFQSYMGRCLDYGAPPQVAGSPVFIYGCNQTAAQQLGVEEMRRRGAHQVRLHAGTLCIGSESDPPASGSALTLQACGSGTGQIFALDGDSILLDSNLDLAVQLKDGVTKSRTPLVLGARTVSDFELWDAAAVDGSMRKPTTGFVNASTPAKLQQALANAGPGTVIELPPDANISFPDLGQPFPLPARVTIRGDRRGEAEGPQITLSPGHDGTGLFITTGDHVRITGLRLHGAGRDSGGNQPALKGINGNAAFVALIDHNDLSDWTTSAIDLNGTGDDVITCPPSIPVRSPIVRIFRNFIHDNSQEHTDGYGVVSGSGSDPLIFGNMFQKNYHSIASDGFAASAYSAVSNLFMPGNGDTDVDMHGQSSKQGTHDFGGIGGIGAEVSKNTFLGTDKTNFGVRGTPCSGAVDTFYGNVAVRDISGSVTVVPDGQTGQGSVVSWTSVNTRVPFLRVNSRFSMPNPTQAFLVGDFDGDGKDDLFMATGAGWYYSPAGNAEWRFLSAKTETIGSLLLGDFDGDGRADVLTQIGDKWMVSWGGRSDWELLSDNHGGAVNHAIPGMIDFVIGDFIGDGRSDVFYADGTSWWVSDGGAGPFTLYATSSYVLPDILFGDFDGDGKTDVAGVVADQWMFVPANGQHSWTPLRPELTKTMAGLIAADFDGNGKTDIAQFDTSTMPVTIRVSFDGKGDWQTLNIAPSSIAAIGRFDNARGADILIWTDNYLSALSSGSGSAARQSRQDMR
jgi:hypothetical protein